VSGTPGPLAGKAAIVTGASKGLGRAFAETLIGAGAKVAALARASAELDELGRTPGILAIACDMAEPAQVRGAIDQVAAHFGRIDIVVNNAAITSLLPLENASAADIEREYAVNLLGPANASSAAIQHLRAAGGGDLVFISSESVRVHFPFLSLYASSKAGLESLAAELRNELRAQGTRVTILRSGSVDTNSALRATWPEDRLQHFASEAARLGSMEFTGTPVSMATMAQTLLALLTLPRDVNIDLVEARGRAPRSA